jgi:hypothetical protein
MAKIFGGFTVTLGQEEKDEFQQIILTMPKSENIIITLRNPAQNVKLRIRAPKDCKILTPSKLKKQQRNEQNRRNAG